MLKGMNFSIQKISEITKRGWSTVKTIIEADFKLDKYKSLSKAARQARKLTFRPFNEQTTPGPVKIKEIPVKTVEVPNTLSNMDEVLNHMWELQQSDTKALVNKAEKDEAIHKIRNGLQKISEGLGELL